MKGRITKTVPGFSGRITGDAPLAEYTTLRVGGPAPLLLEPVSAEDVRRVLTTFDDIIVIGAGSNVLISDMGVGVPVLKTADGLKEKIGTRSGLLTAGAGRGLPALVTAAASAGFSGLEWAAGIPGTVGGALAVNAGAFGSEIWEFVASVEVVPAGGAAETVKPDAVTWGYRSAELGVERPFVVIDVELKLVPGDRETIRRFIREYGEKRKKAQPLSVASAGSFFKNPPGGPPAGKVIDEAGLKGARCAGAFISEVHANFIVNAGGARADEVYTLAEFVRHTVADRTGIELEYEVELIGEFNYLGDDAIERRRL